MQRMYSKKVYIILFLLPALILFCGVLIAPIGASAYFSLFKWNGFGPKVFIGLKNYKELFTSNSIGFMKALRNSLLLAGLSVFLQLPLALGLALTLGCFCKVIGVLGQKLLRAENQVVDEVNGLLGRETVGVSDGIADHTFGFD